MRSEPESAEASEPTDRTVAAIDRERLAGMLREQHAFSHALNHAGDTDLVDHLGQLSAPDRTDMCLCLGIGGEHRLCTGHSGRRAAAENAELAMDGALLAAGNRCIDKGLGWLQPCLRDRAGNVC